MPEFKADEVVISSQGQIPFKLVRTNRKTMEIAVHPDKSVVIRAPLKSKLPEIKERVQKRADWIARQIKFFEQFEPRTPPRQYVDGEEHFYLGSRYRLKITKSKAGRVALKNGKFFVESSKRTPENVQELLEGWYRTKAKDHFANILELCWADFDGHRETENGHQAKKPDLRIKKMKTRWGSMSTNRALTLNLELIKVPRECIEYVIIHELCHLKHHNHGSGFYRLLETKLPDWQNRKQRLERSLA